MPLFWVKTMHPGCARQLAFWVTTPVRSSVAVPLARKTAETSPDTPSNFLADHVPTICDWICEVLMACAGNAEGFWQPIVAAMRENKMVDRMMRMVTVTLSCSPRR